MPSALIICLLLIAGKPAPLSAVEDGYLELYVKDATGKPVRLVQVSCKEQCASSPTDSRGKARLRLPPHFRSDDWVTLVLAGQPRNTKWVLISPWDNRVNVPSFANKSENITAVIVVQKGDKQILRSGVALQSLVARCLGKASPSDKRIISDEDRKQILKEQAEAVGLTSEEMDQAIRQWGKRASDPYVKGLAALYEQDFPEAEMMLNQSYLIRKEAQQKANADLVEAAFFLGVSIYEQGKYSAAADKFQEVNSLKKDDPTVLGWLGSSLNYAGRYSEAEPLLERALDLSEKVLGREHPDTATSLNGLALLYKTQGKYKEAEALYKRTLEIREKALGAEHLDTATSLNGLAELYRVQGKYEEAEPLYERALEILEKALGSEHRFTAGSLNNLAELYREQGKVGEAEPLYKRALEISEKVLGAEHPDTATYLNNLATLYASHRKYEEAEPLYNRALAIREKVLSRKHPDTATSLNNLAELYRVQGKYEEAEPLYERALEIRKKLLGPEHPLTAISLNNLALLYYFQGKWSEAEPLYKLALAIFENVLGAEHPNTAAVLENYVALLRKLNREEEAAKLESRAKEIREKAKLKSKN